MEFITVKEAAQRWKLTTRRIQDRITAIFATAVRWGLLGIPPAINEKARVVKHKRKQ